MYMGNTVRLCERQIADNTAHCPQIKTWSMKHPKTSVYGELALSCNILRNSSGHLEAGRKSEGYRK